MKQHEYQKGAAIIFEGQKSDEGFFIIRSGSVRVRLSPRLQVADEPEILGEGDAFGVVSTIAGHSEYLEIAYALTDVKLISVPREEFCSLVQSHTSVAVKIMVKFSQWTRVLSDIIACFAGDDVANVSYAPAYGDGGGKQLGGLGDAVNRLLKPYAKGARIITEGDKGDEMFIIQSGRVQITKKTPVGGDMPLSILGPGDIFGEIAILDSNDVRSASAIAVEDCGLLALDRAKFDHIAKTQPQIMEYLARQQARRILRLYRHIVNIQYYKGDTLLYMYDMLLIKLEEKLGDLGATPVIDYTLGFGIRDLADMAGLSNDDNATAYMNKLLQDEYIDITGQGKIRVLNIQKFMELVVSYRKKYERECKNKQGG